MGFDPISIGLMVAGLAISAGGAAMSQEAQAKQLKARQGMSNLQAQNERLDQVRQSRIKSAQILQAGATQGVGESSAVTGGAQSVQGQAESNIGYIGQQQGLVNDVFSAQRGEMNAAGITNIGKGVTSIGSTLFDPDVQAGIKKTYNDIFGD